jgi:hypothetical protein
MENLESAAFCSPILRGSVFFGFRVESGHVQESRHRRIPIILSTFALLPFRNVAQKKNALIEAGPPSAVWHNMQSHRHVALHMRLQCHLDVVVRSMSFSVKSESYPQPTKRAQTSSSRHYDGS